MTRSSKGTAKQCTWIALLFLLVSTLPAAADAPLEDEPGQEQQPPVKEQTAAEEKPWYKRLVPVPLIITEPAIGEGLAVGVGYFHAAKSPDTYQAKRLENSSTIRDVSVARKPPPTVTGVFGGVTNNGTWAGGVGHMNSFRNDSIRYLGAAAYANVVTDLYVFDQAFEFNLEGILVYQDVKFRLGESNWFLGTALSYLDATNEFRIPPPEPGDVNDGGYLSDQLTDTGLVARLMYESRDDSLMPSEGQLFDLSLKQNGQWLGGEYEYTTLKLKMLSFHRLGERFVLGLRGEYTTVGGSPPFFSVPWVTLRGIPAMRFQGKDVAVAEVEGRYDIGENWAAVAFYGRGWTRSDIPGMDTEEDIDAYGLGGRYRLLKEQNVWVGLDLARGPEDTVFYVQVGHPW